MTGESERACRAEDLLADPESNPVDLLDVFADTGLDPQTRDATLMHPAVTSEEILLCFDRWPQALIDRAMSVTDDRALLERWMASPVPFERAVVAMNPHCPYDISILLAGDDHPAVRSNVACCPQLPSSLRAGIATQDPDPTVREFAHWLLTTTAGRDLIEGRRYAAIDARNDDTPNRVIAYGISREVMPPV